MVRGLFTGGLAQRPASGDLAIAASALHLIPHSLRVIALELEVCQVVILLDTLSDRNNSGLISSDLGGGNLNSSSILFASNFDLSNVNCIIIAFLDLLIGKSEDSGGLDGVELGVVGGLVGLLDVAGVSGNGDTGEDAEDRGRKSRWRCPGLLP